MEHSLTIKLLPEPIQHPIWVSESSGLVEQLELELREGWQMVQVRRLAFLGRFSFFHLQSRQINQ